MSRQLRRRLLSILTLLLLAGLALWQNYRATRTADRPGQPVNLGLDLQGGMHLGLELDESERHSTDRNRDLDLALAILRKRMDALGVTERVIQRVGDDRIVVELPGVHDQARAREIVQQSAFLEFRLTQPRELLLQALPAMDRALGGGQDLQQLLGGTAATPRGLPGEFLVPEADWRRADSLLRDPSVKSRWPRNADLRWAATGVTLGTRQYRPLYLLTDRPIITGANLVEARAELDPLTQAAQVTFRLDHAGGARFGEATGRNLGGHLAILLDGVVQGPPPVIESRIDRTGRIELSGRTLAQAQELAITLQAGALPMPLHIVEEHQIGPSLGQDSIRGGVVAGVVGTALVVLIMVGCYAWSGVLAVGALGCYMLLTLGGLVLVGATLTLPGLAGFVLSIGFAVDANVLIFERMREELAAGRGVRRAVDEGFRHAMPAIIDSNLTTALTALFLFQFGTGPVKGFAVTLIVGILASMVTAIFITRTCYLLWLERRPDATHLSLGALRLFRHSSFDFLRRQRLAVGVTVVLLGAGLVGMGNGGINYGVEFTGGSLLQVRTQQPADIGGLRTLLHQTGLRGAEIQRFGDANTVLIRAGLEQGAETSSPEMAAGHVAEALDRAVGPGSYQITRSETVGPKVGGELRQQAFGAIGWSFLAVLGYLAWRFEWRYGVAAVLATGHDILATIAFIALTRLEVGLVVVAALLTVVGYSLNDTIVIFDRIRERRRADPGADHRAVLNLAINETLPRTVLTGGTALATLTALALFGGEVIRPFALVMFFGIFTGTFSSMFIAAPALRWIERRWPVRAGEHPAPTLTATPATG